MIDRRNGRWLRALVTLPLVLAGAPSALLAQDPVAAMIAQVESPQSPYRQGLDASTVPEVMRRYRVPGVSVAVIKDFEVHWAKGYGVADVETGAPVTTSTLFQAASVSKPVAAMAVLRAVQEGRVSLDRDVNDFLSSWKVPPSDLTRSQPVTLRALLSHTSGADDGFGFPGYQPGVALPTVLQILGGERPSNVGPVLFARPPFAAYKYSGGGIAIAQLAMMDVFGKPFADIMRDLVLAPAGMRDSTYEQPLTAGLAAGAARAHSRMGRAMAGKWHVYPEQAAAGLWTTASDLARFAIEVQTARRGPGGRVLSQAMAREMTTPVGVGPFALGLVVDRRGEGWYVSHTGDNWGFKAGVWAHVLKGFGVAVMANGDGGLPVIEEIQARVARAYGWDSLDKPLPR